MANASYVFSPGNRSILAEIFLPKRIVLQGTLYRALEGGLTHKHVLSYLTRHARVLMKKELCAYPQWFDPNWYGGSASFPNPVASAKARMSMCSQVFFGWSTYEVNGVFLKHDNKTIDEETTQVIRLIFKFDDEDLRLEAQKLGHLDVYRSVVYWVLSLYGNNDGKSWTENEMDSFLRRHPSWKDEKLAFAQSYYPRLAASVNKWIDDCGLFIFGYLVRSFWVEISKRNAAEAKRAAVPNQEVVARSSAHLEDEIWVSSIFHYNINIMALGGK